MSFDYSTYLSPFTWRYGSQSMRRIWSEKHKRLMWRRIWVALAEAEADFGLVSQAQLRDLRAQVENVDVGRALEIESEIHHDLMAELKAFAEQAQEGGAILHLGATSADIEDNADVLRTREALDLVLVRLRELLLEFAKRIEQWAETPLIAFTHLQPAEPSTLGYRLALYAQDIKMDWECLSDVRQSLKGKGIRGAVGTSASFADLIGVGKLEAFEARISERVGLEFFPITGQVYPRKQDYCVISALSGLGGSLYKFAFDLRFLQSPGAGEWSEPFGKLQVGSSAMPFKRNPIQAEKIDSLGRQLAQMPRLAWDNAAHSLLERTLDDSANRRTLLPESFLLTDEMLTTMGRVLSGLVVDQNALARNLAEYGPFASIERVLMAVSKTGADRQEMHERLRKHAMVAWEAVRNGDPNPLVESIPSDPELQAFLPVERLKVLMDSSDYVGEAPRRAREFAIHLREMLERGTNRSNWISE